MLETHLLYAVLAASADLDASGRLRIIQPWGAIGVRRDARTATGVPLTIAVEPFVLVLGFFGEIRDRITLSITAFHPDKSYNRVHDDALQWGDSPYSVQVIQITQRQTWTVPDVGITELRILVDGSPVGVVPLVVYWQ